VPFAGLLASGQFALSDRLSLAAEAGFRYGRAARDARSETALFDVAYREFLAPPPVVLRMGITTKL
jgi:hypothetical protein